MTDRNIADIYCPNCGASAHFDIRKQKYVCGYCGGNVRIDEAQKQRNGFRQLAQSRIHKEAKNYKLIRAECPGCGAEIVIEENEALSDCAFCGKALVRKEYLYTEDMPEMIIPFRITIDEAEQFLLEWCDQNKGKREAGDIRENIKDLKGFYLPYELIRGPINCTVSRIDGGKQYDCSGYVDDVFVNCSKQLDNLLLDGMEPYELDEVKEFDFAYTAGQRIKIKDINAKELQSRVEAEVSESYTPTVRKTLETKAVKINAYVHAVSRLPVLLPGYYLKCGNTIAAVNGQTAKVSVRAEKESHYYFLPWWLKSILATILISAVCLCGLRLFRMDNATALYLTGILAFFFLIVTLCAYSDTEHTDFAVKSGYKVFQSKGGPWHRENGVLVQKAEELKRNVTEPVFFEEINGKEQAVSLRFTTPLRIIRMGLLAVFVIFLPVLLALFLNGFNFRQLELGGSAVWFCIFIPVVPIYVLKFGIIELYERPWIYLLTENRQKKRYRQPIEWKKIGKWILAGLKHLIIPPECFAIWLGIACFCMIVYLTAFGF